MVDAHRDLRGMTALAEARRMAKASTRARAGGTEFSQGFILKLLGHVQPTTQEPEVRKKLVATIHDEIIPKLVLAHWGDADASGSCPDARPPPTSEEVYAFARLAVRQELPAALAFVERLAAEGVSLELILLHLIAPAARLLGDEWLADLTSWVDVTIGLGTLQQVIHVLGPSFSPPTDARRGLVVLTAAPGEQHTLGIYLLGEFLRRAGWGVRVAPEMSDLDLLECVAAEHVDMVGISVSNSSFVKSLERLVVSLKQMTLNPKMTVMLGGSLDLASDAEKIGAKFCSDPRDAVRWLEHRSLAYATKSD